MCYHAAVSKPLPQIPIDQIEYMVHDLATAFTIARCPTDCSEVRIGQWIMKEQEKEEKEAGQEGRREGRPFMLLPSSLPPVIYDWVYLCLGPTEVKFPSPLCVHMNAATLIIQML